MSEYLKKIASPDYHRDRNDDKNIKLLPMQLRSQFPE